VNAPSVDYDAIAAAYAADRAASPRLVGHVLAELSRRGARPGRLLEVGCGTADHLAALCDALGAEGAGLDRSEGMLAEGRRKHPGLVLRAGDAEREHPFPPEAFDLVFSVDVVHYLSALPRCFAEARRALRSGGFALAVTDAHEQIPRRSISRYFPESVAPELARYPDVPDLVEAMRAAGLVDVEVTRTEHAAPMTDALAEPYRRRAFSALRLLPEAAFQAGLRRLEAAIAEGTAEAVEVHAYVWGRRGG
jgi:SAM-dependent methyltransferase